MLAVAALLWNLCLLPLPQVHGQTPPAPPQPRIHVYLLPTRLSMEETSEVGVHPGTVLLDKVCRSDHYEPDPAKADYFWIPTSGRVKSKEKLVEVIEYVRQEFPWWNETVAKGEARHIMVTTRDSDPGQSFGWPLDLRTYNLEYNPVSPTRNIIFLTFNGMQDGIMQGKDHCVVCFQPGKDIMIPKFQGVCNGPLCGFDLQTLRAKSIWALPSEQQEAQYRRRRKRLMFFGGSALDHHDFTGRGGVALYYGNNKRYLIQVSGSSKAQVSFPEAMLNTEFCYSPLGGNGGPTDRYVSGAMFGCIPVMLNSSHTYKHGTGHALPLEEVLPWHKFATLADTWELETLDKQLHCLTPHIPHLRATLSEVWQSLVWSSIPGYGPFLNEDGSRDAWAALMRILMQRKEHGWAPPKHVAAAFSHPGTLFPCRHDSPV